MRNDQQMVNDTPVIAAMMVYGDIMLVGASHVLLYMMRFHTTNERSGARWGACGMVQIKHGGLKFYFSTRKCKEHHQMSTDTTILVTRCV